MLSPKVNILASPKLPQIVTRKQALAEGLPRYFTGKPCKGKNGHLSERYTLKRQCVECSKERYDTAANTIKVGKWRDKHPEHYRAYQREYQRHYRRKPTVSAYNRERQRRYRQKQKEAT